MHNSTSVLPSSRHFAQYTAGLAMNSSVTSSALNTAAGVNVTAIDSSSGGAVLINSSRTTADVDNNTVLLSGMLAMTPHCSHASHAADSALLGVF